MFTVDHVPLPSHRTPEAAALAHWDAYPEAGVVVVSVEFTGPDSATVVTDTDPSHPMYNLCRRERGGWVCFADHN